MSTSSRQAIGTTASLKVLANLDELAPGTAFVVNPYSRKRALQTGVADMADRT